MIFTLFCSKISRLQDPVLKSLVQYVLWPYFSDFMFFCTNHAFLHACCSHIIEAQFVLNTVKSDLSHENVIINRNKHKCQHFFRSLSPKLDFFFNVQQPCLHFLLQFLPLNNFTHVKPVHNSYFLTLSLMQVKIPH